ncbi:hypothetical protein DN069_09715 [Streptacidiphilus pinicola]|uniref:DUF4012 domain-containing protein n=1 Tax=Streptacidiphilus pinicola TaxID=2219663 RepID=A0A2X0K922_9ACTN|nr:DUF4012 domain-containing protein [Streptacidiphilus pinicola]RAG85775.1 hypothetical protein DN069_09715 [Streptacidiphilus pinicola]
MALLLPSALLTAWLLAQAWTAEAHLGAAQATVARLRNELLGGASPAQQDRDVVQLRADTGAARRATSGMWWSAMARIPLAGRPLKTVHGIAVAADALATQVLPEVATLRRVAGPAGLVRQDGVDLGALTQTAPVLARLEGSLTEVRHGLEALPDATGLGRVDDARARLTRDVAWLAGAAGEARTAVRLAVPALGGSGPRSYFLGFQTNAEARGTGGLVGAFGVVTANHGRITVHDLSSDDAMAPAPAPVADLGAAFEARYGAAESSRLLANSNLSAHFPYAAQIWTGLWRRRTGQRLDGAIATDPVGLAQLLEATGPVRLPSGELLTASDTVALTESTSYARYTDKAARKRFLVQVAQAVSEALLHGRHDPVSLLRALGHLSADGRLRMWSADPSVQAALEGTELAGIVPERPGPYAALVLNNSAGNKLDYYVDRSLRYDLGPCAGGYRTSTVQIRLTDRAPTSGLPSYITLRSDDPTHPHPPGSTLVWVSFYASMGAQLWDAELDGRPLLMSPSEERGHLVLSTEVELIPGRPRAVDLRLLEPASSAAPVVPVQPLVRPQTTQVLATACS